VAVVLEISPALTSFPMPLDGAAVSFATTKRSSFPWACELVNDPLGVPTPINPPIMTLAPWGIMSTASSIVTLFMIAR
jgi:hypothetical protein